MASLLIHGGKKLEGSVGIHGAKNAVLPILAASILTEKQVTILECPDLTDVQYMLDILRALGCQVTYHAGEVTIDSSAANRHSIPEDVATKMRSSIFMLGPILARFGRVDFTYPGGWVNEWILSRFSREN
jgi:UDP-N-acetylglucosamine 1-carboxyvinyltransferase